MGRLRPAALPRHDSHDLSGPARRGSHICRSYLVGPAVCLAHTRLRAPLTWNGCGLPQLGKIRRDRVVLAVGGFRYDDPKRAGGCSDGDDPGEVSSPLGEIAVGGSNYGARIGISDRYIVIHE